MALEKFRPLIVVVPFNFSSALMLTVSPVGLAEMRYMSRESRWKAMSRSMMEQ